MSLDIENLFSHFVTLRKFIHFGSEKFSETQTLLEGKNNYFEKMNSFFQQTNDFK